jgi:glycosyltransferase involved in cell wall biosynthesis
MGGFVGSPRFAVTSDPQILFIDHTGELAGGQLCLADIVVRLRNRCAVFLFERGPFGEFLEKQGVTVRLPKGEVSALSVRKKSGWLAYLASGPNLLSLVRCLAREAKGFDLLYANTAKALMVTAVTALLLRKPFLFHLHDIISPEHFNRLNSWLLVTGANLANGIVANSEASAAAYRKEGGKNRNLIVIPNGFEIERFAVEASAPVRAIRTAIGAENRPLVGLFGRIAAWKGQKVLIQALSSLPEVSGVLVGEALFTDEDQQYKGELIHLLEKLGLSNRVQLVGFQLDILPYLKAVDLVVHCSVSPEPFGRVIVEAQLAGKPVIATRGGGPSEIIQDRLTGILVEPNDPKHLAKAIRELLEDRKWAGELAARGRQAAIARFGLENVLNSWTEFIYRTALGSRTSRSPNRESLRSAMKSPSEVKTAEKKKCA